MIAQLTIQYNVRTFQKQTRTISIWIISCFALGALIFEAYLCPCIHRYDIVCVSPCIHRHVSCEDMIGLQAVLLSIPAVDIAGEPITVIELGATACVCPKDVSNLRKLKDYIYNTFLFHRFNFAADLVKLF